MKKFMCLVLVYFFCMSAHATLHVPMYLTKDKGVGKNIGVIDLDDTIYGLMITPRLKYLPQGVYGFHVHAFPLCSHHGEMAGGHLDIDKTNEHLGPYNSGHIGDLPVLIVNAKHTATLPLLAPRLKLSQIKGKSLVIHAGADNYADVPKKLGGGGLRIACGVIPYH